MYPKANFISRNADLCRRLCRLPLSGYEQSMAQQLDSTEKLFIRHCHNRPTGLAQSTVVPNPELSLKAIRCASPEAGKMPPENLAPELVIDTPARRPTFIQAAEEQAPFPESLSVLVAERAQTKLAGTALAA
jgi:hypothetical protein